MTTPRQLEAKRRLRRALPYFAGVLGAILALKVTVGGRLMYTVTGSIPRGVYWITPTERAKWGEYVTFPIPDAVRQLIYDRHYLPPSIKLLAKPVAAVEGDHVCLRDDELFVNQHHIAVVRRQDAQGRELPRHEICRVLTEGELYVATTHENSFDSRNFGPIASAHLRGTLTPVLTADQF